jgi:hypothetical protein
MVTQVLPSEYGTHKHPLFLFDLRYIMRCFSCSAPGSGAMDLSQEQLKLLKEVRCSDTNEDVNTEIIDDQDVSRIKVALLGLRKRYSDGKLAVKNFSVALLEGQITCLLGHNGAGDYLFRLSVFLNDHATFAIKAKLPRSQCSLA